MVLVLADRELSGLNRARLIASLVSSSVFKRWNVSLMQFPATILMLAMILLVSETALAHDPTRLSRLENGNSAAVKTEFSSNQIAALMRPSFAFESEWLSRANDVEVASFDAKVTMPTYPFFGPPPPMIHGSFSYSTVAAPLAFDLPDDLYDYSVGMSWMRPINQRWLLRFMASAACATDGKNTTSDAWQFRGGAFAMYRPNQRWTWIMGAIALGRADLPVVPAVGVIWQPTPTLRFDLTLPRPKIAFLLADNGPRQQWGYVGGEFTGGTWAYERANGMNDQLSYGDWRVVVGWESIPTPEPEMPFTRGRKVGVETGYVFGRDFEFERGAPTIELANAWMLRGWVNF